MTHRIFVLVTGIALLIPFYGVFASGLEPGTEAPSFSTQDLGGNPQVLRDLLAEGPLVLCFFRTDCSSCRKEIPIVNKLSLEDRFKALRFLAVNVKEKQDVVSSFVDEHHLTLSVALDPKMTITRAYRVSNIPKVVYIRQDGTVHNVTGPGTEDELRRNFQSLLDSSVIQKKVFLVVPSLDLDSGRLVLQVAEAGGFAVDVWEILKDGPLPESVIHDHLDAPLIRCIPENRPEYAIGPDEETALLGFLSDGGRLCLCGNDAFESAAGLELIKYYLEVRFVAPDAACFNIRADSQDPDFGQFSFSLAEKMPEYGVVAPDIIAGNGSARAVLYYNDDPGKNLPRRVAAMKVKT